MGVRKVLYMLQQAQLHSNTMRPAYTSLLSFRALSTLIAGTLGMLLFKQGPDIIVPAIDNA